MSALTELLGLYRELAKSGLKRAKPTGDSKKRLLAKLDLWGRMLTSLTNAGDK